MLFLYIYCHSAFPMQWTYQSHCSSGAGKDHGSETMVRRRSVRDPNCWISAIAIRSFHLFHSDMLGIRHISLPKRLRHPSKLPSSASNPSLKLRHGLVNSGEQCMAPAHGDLKSHRGIGIRSSALGQRQPSAISGTRLLQLTR